MSRQLRQRSWSQRSENLNLDKVGIPNKPSALEKVKTLIRVPENASHEELGPLVEDNYIADKNSCDKFFTPDEDEVINSMM